MGGGGDRAICMIHMVVYDTLTLRARDGMAFDLMSRILFTHQCYLLPSTSYFHYILLRGNNSNSR